MSFSGIVKQYYKLQLKNKSFSQFFFKFTFDLTVFQPLHAQSRHLGMAGREGVGCPALGKMGLPPYKQSCYLVIILV